MSWASLRGGEPDSVWVACWEKASVFRISGGLWGGTVVVGVVVVERGRQGTISLLRREKAKL